MLSFTRRVMQLLNARREAAKTVGQPAPAMPGSEAQAFARHKESSGLFVSGLSPPMPAQKADISC